MNIKKAREASMKLDSLVFSCVSVASDLIEALAEDETGSASTVSRKAVEAAYWDMASMENHTPEGQIDRLFKRLNAELAKEGE